MDESLQELENELKRLTPRRPSPVLHERIARELERVEPLAPGAAAPVLPTCDRRVTTFPAWKWRGWSLAAAAAIIAGVVFLRYPWQAGLPGEVARQNSPAASQPVVEQQVADASQVPASTPNVYRPVRATNVLYDLQDDGTVYLSDNTPARRVRYRYVDTYTWKNPATNASLKWTVPRDEVRVIPASLH
jgi:hypothetical protein